MATEQTQTIRTPEPASQRKYKIVTTPQPMWKRRWRRFLHNRLSMVGAAIVLLLIVLAAIGPLFAPYPNDATGAVHISDRLKPPTSAHLMGTDDVGRDISAAS